MSTFDGIASEFPEIRIDHFRNLQRPCKVRACFLSHVHSDHLAGLESYNGPFIYCSPATAEMLLCLEKYPNRMNFANGILEQRKQTYKHLRRRLKPIPLETPTCIELEPNRQIRVSLFDANHCPGAVMFLIETTNKAILYTGDIRAEAWWVNSLLRNPILLPYVASADQKPLKQLDNMYLDTTFANQSDHYKQFPSKASGTLELLRKVSQYPKDTLFYFDTWTFGYEVVWQSLSTFLQSRIHVDKYRYKIYLALANTEFADKAPEAAKLIGVQVGNHFQQGCLSTELQRIHSCEKGTGCSIWEQKFVRITPIVTRHGDVEYAELGAGGGHGDLNEQHELELDSSVIIDILELCSNKLSNQPQIMSKIRETLEAALQSPTMAIQLDTNDMAARLDRTDTGAGQADSIAEELIPVERIVDIMAKHVTKAQQAEATAITEKAERLPRKITFPYSRHSSYSELCMLVEAFKPKDIYPCTVDALNWTVDRSMSHLFGHIYEPSQRFSHDQKMLREKKFEDPNQGSHVGNPEQMESQEWEEVQLAKSRAADKLVNEGKLEPKGHQEQKQDRLVGKANQQTLGNALSAKRKRFLDPPDALSSLVDESSDEYGSNYNPKVSPPRKNSWPLMQEVYDYSPRKKRRSSSRTAAEGCSRTCNRDADTIDETRRDPLRVGPRRPSPTRLTSRRSTSAVETPRAKVWVESGLPDSSWSQPPLVEDTSYTRERQINQWQKQIAVARGLSFLQCRSSPSIRPPQGECHGRLSPPEMPLQRPMLLNRPISRGRRRRQAEDYGRLSPVSRSEPDVQDGAVTPADADVLPDGEALKNALKQEAFDSVLGVGLDWSDIGLITVNGHHKEEEL